MDEKLPWKNFDEFFLERACKQKDKTFLKVVEDGSSYSYNDCEKITSKVINFLREEGVKRGDVVATICHNLKEYIFLTFAALRMGAAINAINPHLTENEYEFILNDSNARYVFYEEEVEGILNKLHGKTRLEKRYSLIDLIDMSAKFNDVVNIGSFAEDDAFILYSSGTTGNPKGIVLSQANVMYEALAAVKLFHFNTDTVFLLNLPLFFSGGVFACLMNPFAAGASFVIWKKFSKRNFWRVMSEYKVTHTYLVPTMLSIMMNPPVDVSSLNLCVEFIFSGSAYVAPELLKAFEAQYHCKIIIVYGLTENTALCCGMDPKQDRVLESMGKPMPYCRMWIEDDKGNILKPGKQGEIIIEGKLVSKGYLNNEDATAKTFQDGKLYSGDLGYMDEKGNFYYVSRKKEIIIKGGENISPVQIDEVFLKHDKVADCATVGVPDKIYGEEIVCFIVPKVGVEFEVNELIDFCLKRISKFKCPKDFVFVKEIPKTASGKTQRRKLVVEYQKSREELN